MVVPDTPPNDRFGYSVYALVAHASPDQARMVAEVRRAISLKRATIPAHVTIRGTFHSIKSLDEMRSMLRIVASRQKPAEVMFSPAGWKFLELEENDHIGLMPCETTPDLLALNQAFDAVIRPRSTNAYPDEYFAHMTLCQDCTDEQIAQAKALAADLDIGAGFRVNSVELMGRAGPAYGGEWKLIESFPLTR